MYINILFVICIFSCNIFAITNNSACNANKCYQTVNNSYESLLNLIKTLNSTSTSSKYPEAYNAQKLKNDVKQSKNIEKKIQNLSTHWENFNNKIEAVNFNTTGNQEIVAEMLQKLHNLAEYNNTAKKLLNDGNKIRKLFENKLATAAETAINCQAKQNEAHNKHLELMNIIKDLMNGYDNVTNNYNNLNKKIKVLNKKIKLNFNQTVKTRSDFDKLKLPTNLVNNYIYKTEIEFNKSVNYLKKNTNLLKSLLDDSQKKWNKQLQKKENKILQYIKTIQDDVNQMTIDFKKYEKEFDNITSFQSTVDDDSKALFNEIKEILEKNLYKKIVTEINEKRALLKIYKTVLDAIPTDDKFQTIKNRIDNLRTAVDLIRKWRYLQYKVTILRENRNEIKNINCSAFIVGGLLT